jgi:hypothetical protein
VVTPDIDFILSEEYAKKDAEKAINDANFTVRIARKVVNIL